MGTCITQRAFIRGGLNQIIYGNKNPLNHSLLAPCKKENVLSQTGSSHVIRGRESSR